MSQCAQCGTEFNCQMVDGLQDGQQQAACWCTALPPLTGVLLEGTCLCPTCLRERLQATAAGRELPDATA